MLRFVQPPFPCLWSDGLLRSSNLAFVTKDGCFSCSLLDSLPLTNYLLCQRQKSFVFCSGKTHNLSRACIWAIFEREHCCILQFFYTKPLTKKRRMDTNILAT